jgi:hypothetical protein
MRLKTLSADFFAASATMGLYDSPWIMICHRPSRM